jgi:hypothetical protein
MIGCECSLGRERSPLSPTLYTHMTLQPNRTERLRSILLFNQTKDIAALFCLPNAEYNGSILKK